MMWNIFYKNNKYKAELYSCTLWFSRTQGPPGMATVGPKGEQGSPGPPGGRHVYGETVHIPTSRQGKQFGDL